MNDADAWRDDATFRANGQPARPYPCPSCGAEPERSGPVWIIVHRVGCQHEPPWLNEGPDGWTISDRD